MQAVGCSLWKSRDSEASGPAPRGVSEPSALRDDCPGLEGSQGREGLRGRAGV